RNISIIGCIVSKSTGGGSLPYGSNYGIGININQSREIIIQSSIISDNKGGGPGGSIGYGIKIKNSTKVLIDSCTIEGHLQSLGGVGIELFITTDCQIRNNKIRNNHIGIAIGYKSNAQIGGSKLFSNQLINNRLFSVGLSDSLAEIDARWNYWGYDNVDSISTYIFDCHDRQSISCVDFSNYITSSIGNVVTSLPITYILNQNYPNPFNPKTTISFEVPTAEAHYGASLQKISLEVHDLLGRKVATLVDETEQPGNYSVKFDGSNLASGMYFYSLITPNNTITKKMILVK
ncbi:MAG: T9SS type A sorting domain-containing protein, partial [Ignavibacteria bacterium]|nr:T9SS type A sorting domain-containing protein [Ignavibacteria bacterium]